MSGRTSHRNHGVTADHVIRRIAWMSGCSFTTVRDYYAGRLVSGWCARQIEAAEQRIRSERRA